MTRLRLRATASLTALLLLVPALALWRLPRPRAQGLERLLAHVALLQSLPAAPGRPVPQLWRQRLGLPLAQRLWSQQRQVWWQTWGRHGDGDAYLVLPLRGGSLAAVAPPANSLQFDDLLVVAADPLSLRLLQDQLATRQRPVRGLERRCVRLLQQQEAVFWKPVGLGGISGDLAPLLFSYQEGCLSLELQPGALLFRGEATASPDQPLSRDGDSDQAPASDSQSPLVAPLPDALYLDLQGAALQPLLQGLLARQLVRDVLAQRYGVTAADLSRLRQAPFRLSLRPQASGPFRAGLELQLQVGDDPQPWLLILNRLRSRLQEQDLQEQPPRWRAPQPGAVPLPESVWQRQDGAVVGGWIWRAEPGRPSQLVLFLGPLPQGSLPPAAQPLPRGLVLRLRPRSMAEAGLLPASLPQLVSQAQQLQVRATGAAGPLSRLWGRLRLDLPPRQR